MTSVGRRRPRAGHAEAAAQRGTARAHAVVQALLCGLLIAWVCLLHHCSTPC
jgi:hypothetical protein